MDRTSANSSSGFSLIELLVALAVGMLVVGAAVKLFSQGMAATFVVSQRAEMQQDLRASFRPADQRHKFSGRWIAFRDRHSVALAQRRSRFTVTLPVAPQKTIAPPGTGSPTHASPRCESCAIQLCMDLFPVGNWESRCQAVPTPVM